MEHKVALITTQAMSKHDGEDAEDTGRGTQTLRVKVKEGSIEEIQLCLQLPTPEGADEGLRKSANKDKQRFSLQDAHKGSCGSDGPCGDADEVVYRTMQGLNRPSFQPPSRCTRDEPNFKFSGKEATHYQRFANNGCEAEEYGDDDITQITVAEVEGDADEFENIDEESAAEDEDVGDARMPGGAVVQDHERSLFLAIVLEAQESSFNWLKDVLLFSANKILNLGNKISLHATYPTNLPKALFPIGSRQ